MPFIVFLDFSCHWVINMHVLTSCIKHEHVQGISKALWMWFFFFTESCFAFLIAVKTQIDVAPHLSVSQPSEQRKITEGKKKSNLGHGIYLRLLLYPIVLFILCFFFVFFNLHQETTARYHGPSWLSECWTSMITPQSLPQNTKPSCVKMVNLAR